MKKRFVWMVVSCLMVAALVLTSCGPAVTKEEEEVVVKEGPKYGGTLRIGGAPDHTSLDPALLLGSSDMEVSLACYNGLVRLMPDMSYQPELAVSWEPNADVTQYTFKLRQGVKFHNGKDFKAEDVVFSFQRLIDPKVGSPFASSLDMVNDIVAVDDYTVRFELSRPDAFFIDKFVQLHAKVLPKGVDTKLLTSGEVGTGPFIVQEYVEGEHAILKRNPDYWQEGIPYLDEVQFFFMAEDATRLASLRAGDLDVEYLAPPAELPMVKSEPGIITLTVPSGWWFALVMMVDVPPFDNKLVRKALQYATDRELINQAAFFGYGTPARDHPISPTDPYFAEEIKVPPYDPERARELLAEAGYPDGIDLDLHTMDRLGMKELAVAYKESAAPAGIRVNVILDTEDTYWADVWMKVPFCVTNWSPRTPAIILALAYKSGAPWNETHYSNPELDTLLEEAAAEPDMAKRKAMFARIQEMLVDDVPSIITTFSPVFIFTRDYVRGIVAHPAWLFYLYEAWLDK